MNSTSATVIANALQSYTTSGSIGACSTYFCGTRPNYEWPWVVSRPINYAFQTDTDAKIKACKAILGLTIKPADKLEAITAILK